MSSNSTKPQAQPKPVAHPPQRPGAFPANSVIREGASGTERKTK